MRWYVNDLSVQRQFGSTAVFNASLKDLLLLRKSKLIANKIYCARDTLRHQFVTENATLIEAIRLGERDFRNIALQWLDRFGPFIEEDRQPEPDDYFECLDFDVTDQGLGECARRTQNGDACGSFSFPGGALNFEIDPVAVQHGLKEEPLGIVNVLNVWTAKMVWDRTIAKLPPLRSWSELVERSQDLFDRLAISNSCTRELHNEPFYLPAAGSIIQLLDVLQQFMENRREGGELSARGAELLQLYFVGENAWFTDEAPRNKRDFGSAMTFADPENLNRKITCFWHGKVQTPQIRVHFEWPVPVTQSKLKIAYIGPKISKR